MVLDTSALLALLFDEPEAEEFRAAVEEDTTRLVSAATLLETALVIEAQKGEPLLFKGDDFAKTDISRVI